MSVQTEQQTEDGDPTLPTYTATDEESLVTRIGLVSDVNLPILRAPTQWPTRHLDSEVTEEELRSQIDRHKLQVDIVGSFFDAIERGLDDVVERFISGGLVSPDTTAISGETPLLAAVRVRKSGMVRKLISLGAIVNGYGKSASSVVGHQVAVPDRTALQLAAETGNLAIVKILMQDYGADDSLIAPDGALALRLAAANGHREVVEYLPARRGGAWKRWRFAHKAEMDRIRRAFRSIGEFVKIFVWHVPKFFVWTLPKETTKAVVKKAKSAWKRRHEFGGWMKRQVTELPSRLYRAGAKVAKGIKKMPNLLKRIMIRIWRYIKAVPKGIEMFAKWIGNVLAKTGHWVAHVLERFASFIHTVFSAVMSWFKQITLQDVWNGFCSALHAVFVGFPKLAWSSITSFAEFTFKALVAVFGTLGLCLWYCGVGIVWLMIYVPRKIWQSMQAFGRIIAKAVDEVLVYFDPKKV